MSGSFEWTIGETEDTSPPLPPDPPAATFSTLWFLIATAVITGILLSSWYAGRAQLAASEQRLRAQVQAHLDLQRHAFQRGDGELFFTLHANDPAWFSAQLLPHNQAAQRAGLQVTRAHSRDEYVWANVAWSDGVNMWQRVTFFRQRGNDLAQVPIAPHYWGELKTGRYAWGTLRFYEIDQVWATEVAAFVDSVVAELCAVDCLSHQRPFTLLLANKFGETAVPNQVQIPSPRLLALDEAGAPAPRFWRELRQRLEAHLTPAVIRFGVPDAEFPLLEHEQLAAQFMAQNPHIRVEIAPLPAAPTVADLAGLDGVAMTPTAAMLTAGLVFDLTDFANSDPAFDPADFYEQMWQGAQWRSRMWFMPLWGGMRLIFYDRHAYWRANRPEPFLRWSWEEMAQDVTAFAGNTADNSLTWGFLDVGHDALLAYAYNWQNRCVQGTVIHCTSPLAPEAVAAALEWYEQMVAVQAVMPPASLFAGMERQHAMARWQSVPRRAAIWVDLPSAYEYQLLLDPIGVVSFPGSDRFDGVTPLWVEGSFILQGSERPLAAWQWLKYLSHQAPSARFRLIPARPSVARNSGYWATLPQPLGDAMRAAFPFVRPVLIEEKGYFAEAQLTAVVSGRMTPAEAAQAQPAAIWFDAR